MKEYIKTGIILMVYCTIAGFALGFVYHITKDRIALTEIQEKLGAVETVLKDETGNYIVPLDQLKSVVSQTDQEVKVIFENAKGKVYSPIYEFDSPQGKVYVLTGSSLGYGGPVTVVACFVKKSEGFSLFSLKVTDFSQETPGLGAKIGEEEIQRRFYPMEASAIANGVRVDKDANLTHLSAEEAKKQGVAKVSDVMTGATITPRAVANALNAMLDYLSEVKK
ncbi:RnfABCDGE type electron transport complex subunit G [Pseudothermotoga sp.]|nr:RnfABCDGE type electron transport complex subunit G [Pseudothermotoga sp.]MCX7812518.1 RnfABCDGE type electron transport complex subunit G [Pseudothermotoga sp.]MDW8138799.1 RnfABCDGE type electron transport complex subunit G [Pseudothermotoga sp.]